MGGRAKYGPRFLHWTLHISGTVEVGEFVAKRFRSLRSPRVTQVACPTGTFTDPGSPTPGSSKVAKGRFELPYLSARLSENRVSTCCTTWPFGGRGLEICFMAPFLAVGREGIEPLVVHPACFVTTVLQAATGNTTQGVRSQESISDLDFT